MTFKNRFTWNLYIVIEYSNPKEDSVQAVGWQIAG
jgi:hypothetical protein